MSCTLLSVRMTLNDCAIENALSSLYDSDTYAALKSPETGLYSQSPLYVYDYLNDEIPLVKME